MKRPIAVLLLLVLAALPSGCRRESPVEEGVTADTAMTTDTAAASATTTGSTGGTVSAMSDADKEFVIKAAQGGMAEVAMGHVASEKAQNAAVKAFAQRMVADHGKASEELTALANTKGLAMPSDPGEKHKESADHVAGLSGAAFDRMYMKHMVEDHEADVKEFEKAAQSAQDADLKAWAAKTLPTLQDHLRQAKETQAKVK